MLKALITTSRQKNAVEALKVGPSLAHEVAANLDLEQAPAAPALEVYNGVLFDALAYQQFTDDQRDIANKSLIVISALWGAVRPTDRIPAYRLSGNTVLRGLGKTGLYKTSTYWRSHLDPVLSPLARQHVVIDCRSATYAAAFQAPREHSVSIKVVRMVNRRRTVVSHNAKHARGLLARYLIECSAQGHPVHTIADMAELAAQQWDVELQEASGGRAAELTLVLD